MICSVAPLIGGFDLSQDQPIGSPLDMSGEWAGSSKRQITSQMPAGRNRKASLPASTRPPTFSAVAALNNTPSVFLLISAAMNQIEDLFVSRPWWPAPAPGLWPVLAGVKLVPARARVAVSGGAAA
jgi:hypothetical protein